MLMFIKTIGIEFSGVTTNEYTSYCIPFAYMRIYG